MEIKRGQVWKNKTIHSNKVCIVCDDKNNISCIDEKGNNLELSYYELIFNYRLYEEFRTLEDAYNDIKIN